jgi:preprotein translocase subunit SecG
MQMSLLYSVLFVIHLMVTVALIAIILVQRNAGDMGLSGSSSTSFMSGRTAASFITHTTAVLAGAFILLSLAMGVITSHTHSQGGSLLERLDQKQPATEKPMNPLNVSPSAPPAEPAKPVKPAVPRPE